MNFRSPLLLSLAFTGFTLSAAWADSPLAYLPQEIPLDHAGIRWVGRFTEDKTCEWTGSTMTFSFTGTRAQVDITGSEKPESNNYFRVDIDGKMTQEVKVGKGRTTLQIGGDLAPGTHTVQIFRQTEPLWNATTFTALRLDTDARMGPTPPAPERQMLAIGDSITCGYGADCTKPEDGFKADTEKGDRTYAALAARMLGAEYHCVAWSGRGMYFNYGEKSKPHENTLPVIFDLILPTQKDKSPQFDPKGINPDIITVNLGTNDFSHKEVPETEFVATYVEFLKKLQSLWPDAKIICIAGPMQNSGKYKDYVKSAIATVASDKLSFMELKRNIEKEGLGGDWHPNLLTQELNSKVLAEEIARVTGWSYKVTD